MRILVTGATGYIGGRLVPLLLERGWQVRCLARTPSKLRDVPWRADVEVVAGDVLDAGSLARAFRSVDVAYYLVHSIGSGARFAERDRAGARNAAAAARRAGTRRLVYLGGLTPAPQAGPLSPHLRSRAEVAEILHASGVPTVTLRAAVILGSGSASFEMLRYLVERLPVMVTPRWVDTRIQPIAVRDVLRYLAGVADLPGEVNRGFDIGGPEVLTYLDMMRSYARVAGLPRRRVLTTPFLTPRLSSYWIGLVTPVPNAIARPLVESLRNEVVCREHDIAGYVAAPPEGLLGFDDAVRQALRRVREADVATRWSSTSWPAEPAEPLPTDPEWAGGSLYADERSRPVGASRERLWAVIEGIGGERGWYSWPFAWGLRGLVDRLAGGAGLRRGRRDPDRLRTGDVLDFWRVEELRHGRLLRLRAEMRLPGLAWLELGIDGDASGQPVLTQRAIFHPHGLAGQAYWWGVKPFHGIVFGGMIRNIALAAEGGQRRRRPGRRPPPQDPGPE
jgi:uncharacterized protein YbjT (DUF2867 family)